MIKPGFHAPREMPGTEADVFEPSRWVWDDFWNEAPHLGLGGDAGFLGAPPDGPKTRKMWSLE